MSDEQQGGGATPPVKPHPNPIARLRELLSIPERVRTDAQWDEIIEIEITLGPRKPLGGSPKPPHAQQFRQGDHRAERHEKKVGGGGGAGGGGGNKHLRKRSKSGGGGGGGGNSNTGNTGNAGNTGGGAAGGGAAGGSAAGGGNGGSPAGGGAAPAAG